MKSNAYKAIVQIAVQANNYTDACNTITICLSENLGLSGAILDWGYLPDEEGGFQGPENLGEIELPTDEASIFPDLK